MYIDFGGVSEPQPVCPHGPGVIPDKPDQSFGGNMFPRLQFIQDESLKGHRLGRCGELPVSDFLGHKLAHVVVQGGGAIDLDIAKEIILDRSEGLGSEKVWKYHKIISISQVST